MSRKQLLAFLFLPVLPAQNAPLTEAARKLANKPRLGLSELRWRNGQTKEGRIVRVTREFVAFETVHTRPHGCEIVALPDIADVQWRREPNRASEATNLPAVLLVGAMLGPAYVANAVSDPFKRISPPLEPLRGHWERNGKPTDALENGLLFKGNTVHYRRTTTKRGRWSVNGDVLQLEFDGGRELRGHFQFQCRDMILENAPDKLTDIGFQKRAMPPIVGNWRAKEYGLEIKPDGGVIEEKSEIRNGTFENTATELKIHWADSTETVGEIRRRHIFLTIGGVRMEFHYVPPGLELDL